MGWTLLKCLFLEMDGERDEMRIAAKVGYALKCVLDFAEAGWKTMKDAARPFFTRLATHPEVLTEYHKSLDDYVDKARSISHWSPYDRVRVVNADP